MAIISGRQDDMFASFANGGFPGQQLLLRLMRRNKRILFLEQGIGFRV